MTDKTAALPWTDKDLAFWRAEIKASRQKRQDVAEKFDWEGNITRYLPAAVHKGKSNGDINTGVDFSDVERKKAALCFDTPEIGLKVRQDREIIPTTPEQAAALQQIPKPLMLSTLVAWEQDILNAKLGPQEADLMHAIKKAIFDCLCTSGVGPVVVGYQVTMRKDIQQTPLLDEMGVPMLEPVPVLEQLAGALGVMPAPMPKPIMQDVEVEIPIYENWFVRSFSPMALLIPASFKDTKFSLASWTGNDWRKPTSQVRKEHQLGAEWTGKADEAVKVTIEESAGDERDDDAGDPYVTGVEIYYRASLRSDEEVHPEAMRKLVLVDGMDEPLVHVDSPYQDFDETTGKLTKDSMKGFCVRPLVLRDLTDSAWPPPDCAMTAQLTKEGDKYREQVIEQRNGNKMVIAFDSAKLDPTAKDKIVQAHGVTWVPVEGGALAQGVDSIMAQVAQPTLGRETYMGMDRIDTDRERILGIGANQSGQQSQGRKTATEQSIVQRNSEARFEQERNRVLRWIIDVVAAFDTFILRYADASVASEILGESRGQLWAMFKSHLAGGYGYELSVDSGKYLDIEADRRQTLQLYGQVRQDPQVNPRLIIDKIATTWGFDPAEFHAEPQPPQKELKASIAIKSEMLDPALPQFALMVSLLRQGGWQISEDDVKLAQQQSAGMTLVSGVGPDAKAQGKPQHPGMMEKAPTINQKVVDESGQRSGPKSVM